MDKNIVLVIIILFFQLIFHSYISFILWFLLLIIYYILKYSFDNIYIYKSIVIFFQLNLFSFFSFIFFSFILFSFSFLSLSLSLEMQELNCFILHKLFQFIVLTVRNTREVKYYTRIYIKRRELSNFSNV